MSSSTGRISSSSSSGDSKSRRPNHQDHHRDRYKSFHDFYPFYLSQHSKPLTKYFHFVGTTLAMIMFVGIIVTRGGVDDDDVGTVSSIRLWISVPIVGYGFAWISHAFIEKNKPATFEYPLYSFLGDMRLWYEMMFRGKHWGREQQKQK